MRLRFATWPVAAVVSALTTGPARATDPHDLDVFFPTTLEDAFAGDAGESEIQASARYDRRRGRDELLLLPQFQFSPADGLLLSLNLPYTVGSGNRANEGEVGLGALYNLNRESRWLPAFALAVDGSAPIGPGDRATELQLTGIASRSLDAAGRHRLHVNAAWIRRFAPAEEERRGGYRLVLGYSQLLGADTAVIADYLQESQERGERDAKVLELGFRHRVTEWMTVGFGAGLGLGRDSPRLRALLSLEVSL